MKTKSLPILEGIITNKNIGQFWIYSEGKEYCGTVNMAATSTRDSHHKSCNPGTEERTKIVVGDKVLFSIRSQNSAQIIEVLPRINRLARRAAQSTPRSHWSEQIIAANIDQIVAVMSLSQPAPRWNLLDRYLVSAESLEIQPLICLTKSDLACNPKGTLCDEAIQEIEMYKRIGYDVLVTSSITGENMDQLRGALTGRKSILLGKSGAGKSSLINSLLPGLNITVKTVNQATGKGRHSTTGVEMHLGDFNGWLVDTPGTREFGLWGVDEDDLAWFFPEMRPSLGKCRFGLDCRHDEEPDCAIRQAVMAGEIHPRRYFSMMKLKEEGYFHW